jgi:hypothetical protein
VNAGAPSNSLANRCNICDSSESTRFPLLLLGIASVKSYGPLAAYTNPGVGTQATPKAVTTKGDTTTREEGREEMEERESGEKDSEEGASLIQREDVRGPQAGLPVSPNPHGREARGEWARRS